MLPIRDCNPSGRIPYVTWTLIAANVIVFLTYWPLGTEASVVNVFNSLGLVPDRLLEGEQFLAVITAMFVHGGWLHLGFNMLLLGIFGDNLEDEMGPGGFLLFYFACGILANLFQVMAAPGSLVPIGGASGAIAGVMGGYLLMFPKARVDIAFYYVIGIKTIATPAWLMLGIWFGLQLWGGLTTTASGSSVAFWTHIGGFLFGVLLTFRLWQLHGGALFWQRFHGLPPHPTMHVAVPVVRRRGTSLPPVQSPSLFRR